MKQIIFFKKTCVLLLFVFIGNAYLLAQTPGDSRATIVPGENNSCNAGQIVGTGYFGFPVPTGLTLVQLNHLETDSRKNYEQESFFQVIAQAGCGQIEIRFSILLQNYSTFVNSGNVASPGIEVLMSDCSQPFDHYLYSDVQAQYGDAVVLTIKLWNNDDDFDIVYFDNTIINNRTYNYDDCDQDGLLDIYDCDPAHGGNNKVLVCHSGQTICVAMTALQTHLNHGDYMGSCLSSRSANILPPEEVSRIELKLYPNPANDQINIRNSNNKPLGTVSIFDISGKMVYKNFICYSQAIIDVKNISSGVYYLRSDQMENAIKFVKQ